MGLNEKQMESFAWKVQSSCWAYRTQHVSTCFSDNLSPSQKCLEQCTDLSRYNLNFKSAMKFESARSEIQNKITLLT